MEIEIIQVLYSLLGGSPTLVALLYIHGKLDKRISILERDLLTHEQIYHHRRMKHAG
jgi:hypothetical protein